MTYSETNSYLPVVASNRGNRLALFFIVIFSVLSLTSNPFVYDEGNSGRYLLKVIRSADPALFPNDSVVDSLQRFDSIFYDVLAWLFQATSAPPEMVEPAITGLYILGEFVLFFLLYRVTTVVVADIWYFLLVALWATYTVSVPVGGIGIFEPAMRHSEVAFLLCLIVLYCLFAQKFYTLIWLSVAGALLVHSIMAIHFIIVVSPVYLIWQWRKAGLSKSNLGGVGIFGMVLLIYLLFMAPPAMSSEEGELFLNLKGDMQHISPWNQSVVGWFTFMAISSVGLLIWWLFDRSNFQSQQMSLTIVWGSVTGIALSVLASSITSVRLAQFQPMRIFLWVWLLTNLLWLLQTYKQLRSGSLLGILMLGTFFLFMLQSLYALLLVVLIAIYLFLYISGTKLHIDMAFTLDKLAKLGVVCLTCLIGLGLIIGYSFDLSSYFLRSPFPLPLLLLVLGLSIRPSPAVLFQKGVWLTLFVIVIIGASVYWQSKNTSDADWRAVQQWSREHTTISERFLTTPGIGNNFRTGAFRTTISEPMSALAWVDPQTDAQLGSFVERVYEAQDSEGWDLIQLVNLAKRSNADYVVVPGTTKHSVEPAFRTETILVFAVKNN